MTQPKDFETRAREAAREIGLFIRHSLRVFVEGAYWARTEYEAELAAARAELEKQKKRFSMDDGRFYNAEAVDSELMEIDELRAELAEYKRRCEALESSIRQIRILSACEEEVEMECDNALKSDTKI